jgi:hypothetical protein
MKKSRVVEEELLKGKICLSMKKKLQKRRKIFFSLESSSQKIKGGAFKKAFTEAFEEAFK